MQLSIYGKLPTTLPLHFDAKVYHHYLHNCTMLEHYLVQNIKSSLCYVSAFCKCSFYTNLEEILYRLFLPSLSLPFNIIREFKNLQLDAKTAKKISISSKTLVPQVRCKRMTSHCRQITTDKWFEKRKIYGFDFYYY